VIANAAMIAVLLWLQRPLDWWIEASTLGRSLQLGVAIIAGAAAYFVTLIVLGLRLSQFRLSSSS
jgi:putative peptidoglycan lipid II flippase